MAAVGDGVRRARGREPLVAVVTLAARLAQPAAVLSCGERTLDAAAFAREVAAAAHELQGRGVRALQIVAVLSLNSTAMLARLLACERLGAVWMPLNWRLAAPELQQQLDHAGASHLVSDEALAAMAASLRCHPGDGAGAVHGLQGGDLMLVYTSGTTGQPKGALHTTAAMLANIDAAIDAQGLDANTRALAALPLFHVGGLCIQVLPTLAAGGAVRLQPRFDAQAWFDDLAAWRPTTSLLVPATMRALIEHRRWASADLSSLRFVNSGSQIVPRACIDAFHARGVPVAQVYGATETGPVTLVLRPEEAMAHRGSVGRPARGVQVRLVNAEVQVRAQNLARGYHRRPDDAAFADGWFRTGDLARVDGEGFHEIVGRSKDLIVSGGENIHPAEIEQIALADAAVAEAAVVGLPDARWGEVPVLAVVPRAGTAIDAARLQAAFDAALARFKNPRRIVVLAALPKTALGKVRRAELLVDLTQAPHT
jgi:fatty-acyl-CoA synthase